MAAIYAMRNKKGAVTQYQVRLQRTGMTHNGKIYHNFPTLKEAYAWTRQFIKENPPKNRKGSKITYHNHLYMPHHEKARVSTQIHNGGCTLVPAPNRRCDLAYHCDLYLKCLDLADTAGWEGWVTK